VEIAVVVVAREWLGFPMLLDDALRSADFRSDEKPLGVNYLGRWERG
jgi:hypothetical protein